ncbi:hypothetical protein RUND412_010123 [Rhizina undulata]
MLNSSANKLTAVNSTAVQAALPLRLNIKGIMLIRFSCDKWYLRYVVLSYRISSITNVFVLLGLLLQSGVSLNDPVAKYVPKLTESNNAEE